MARYPIRLVSQARRLVASENLSYLEVAKKLKVKRGFVSTWCRGLSGTRWATLIKRNEAKRRIFLESEKGILDKIQLSKRNAKLFSGILYGCEGSKYPASNGVMLTNSDPRLILAFINLLRFAFAVDERKWRVHLQIHNNQNYPELLKYWKNLLKISSRQFFKPTISIPTERKHRNDYKGTCTLKYHDYSLQLKLIGIFDAFVRKLAVPGGVA